MILGKSGLIHLSAATCLCILSVHHLRQLRLGKPFLETNISSLPSGKELLEFRGIVYAVRVTLHMELSVEEETAMVITVFS